ncbi:MAG: hypothetical protein ACLGH0_12870 [Thermoanaerobaculia bacterium]
MRRFLCLLLLVAAAVHPLVHAHTANEALACPWTHGAVAAAETPALTGTLPIERTQEVALPGFVAAPLTADVPARAPPAA